MAALFSGQGSQYTHMFDDAAMNWPQALTLTLTLTLTPTLTPTPTLTLTLTRTRTRTGTATGDCADDNSCDHFSTVTIDDAHVAATGTANSD